ncbi:MAG: hypothetical protein IPK05_04860 [Comamonadaceae bacterium]|nr:hypothetical protein [Comamonadaceae bacterium]
MLLHFELSSGKQSETSLQESVWPLSSCWLGIIGAALDTCRKWWRLRQPNDQAIDRLLKGRRRLGTADGRQVRFDRRFSHRFQTGMELVSGIWAAMLQRKLNYALPASFEHTGQKVRSPSQVLDAGGHMP